MDEDDYDDPSGTDAAATASHQPSAGASFTLQKPEAVPRREVAAAAPLPLPMSSNDKDEHRKR